MHTLTETAFLTLSTGLRRSTTTKPSVWSERYRIMGPPFPGPWSTKYHPWLKGVLDCDDEVIVTRKSAQGGFTEVALNKMFFNADIKRWSCLYVLPTESVAQKFSASRFDPAILLSKHLQQMFTDTKNVEHKRAGSANLFIRGSKSKSKLVSDPIAMLIFDEVDLMYQDNIPLARERMSGHGEHQEYYLSTPTIEKYGISKLYDETNQHHFMFQCPHCSKWTELTFPDSIVITADDPNDEKIYDSHYICKECKNVLHHEDKVNFLSTGKWELVKKGRGTGFHINQLYSTTIRPHDIATSYLRGITNLAHEQEFYNSKLGLPHAVEGAKVTQTTINKCISNFRMSTSFVDGYITMGIDVGKWLHYEVTQYLPGNMKEADFNERYMCKVIHAGKVSSFEELDKIMYTFRPNSVVIDANPERRKALEFAQKYGNVKLCFYGRGVTKKEITIHPAENYTLTVDRTAWLDTSLGRFRNQKIMLPVDIPYEYQQHLQALTRVYLLDSEENPVGKYQKSSDDDHFAHARNYSEIAFSVGSTFATSKNVVGVY